LEATLRLLDDDQAMRFRQTLEVEIKGGLISQPRPGQEGILAAWH
jgi:hypothetical protein